MLKKILIKIHTMLNKANFYLPKLIKIITIFHDSKNQYFYKRTPINNIDHLFDEVKIKESSKIFLDHFK